MPAPSGVREFGIPGLRLERGDHLCAMYVGSKERDEVLLPFLRAGLRTGDKCIAIVDSPPRDSVIASIGDGVDVHAAIASRQLEVRSSDETYLHSWPFKTDAMLDFWREAADASLTQAGYAFMRATGEPPVKLLELPNRTEFFQYESELNRFAPTYPQAIVCLYDLNRFGGGFMVDLLKTHRKLLMGGLIIENPHFLSPDEFLAADLTATEQEA